MVRRRLKLAFDAALGALAMATVRAAKHVSRERTADFIGALMRTIGPLFKEHQIGRENLRAAFPEKSAAEIETILGGVWDNLGRLAAEFIHLDEIGIEGSGRPAVDTVMLTARTTANCQRLRANGRPVLCFAAHLANWEVSALAVRLLGFKSAILFRSPNIGAINNLITRLRTPLMGQLVRTGLDAPVRLARLWQSGVNVGVLADQHFTKGVEVNFFGRPCRANPLLALLARQTGSEIHGLRVVRMPDGNSFMGELTDPIEPVRDAGGGIDVRGTTQAITTVIEGWVREHPEQWLWLHRRWR
jgi:Kdo2-lipid IVA lauroyltransferase/acyltransferase